MKKVSFQFKSVVRESIVMMLIFISTSVQARQMSMAVAKDTVNVFNESLRVLRVEDGIRMKKGELVKNLRKQFSIKKFHCTDGFRRAELSYVFFHTTMEYPVGDDMAAWDIIHNITSKIENSRFLRSGWYVRKNKTYYFLEKLVLTKDDKAFMLFTFFELEGKLAVIIYECKEAELFNQLPIQLAFAHKSEELKIPIFQR